MAVYTVCYMRPDWFTWGIRGMVPTTAQVKQTHCVVAGIKADSLEAVFFQMQGENWSPNGEANDLLCKLGLRHTSMSVGDVIVDPYGDAYVVAPCGFTKLA